MKKLKLLCIPFAGSTAEVYRKWNTFLEDSIEIVPMELKGRGRRFDESFYDTFEETVEDLYNMTLIQTENSEYAIFGHSMGCWLAFELYKKLEENRKNIPIHLFLSGNRAPHVKKEEKKLYGLPDDVFKKEILNIGGTPEIIFENKDLAETYLPILKNDYKILEMYENTNPKKIIDCPVTVIAGTEDSFSVQELYGWKSYCKNSFNIFRPCGDHFNVLGKYKEVVEIICTELRANAI